MKRTSVFASQPHGVVNSGQSPAHVADQLDVPLADVYEALSYHCTHIEEMYALEAGNEATFEDLQGSSVKRKETVQQRRFSLTNASNVCSSEC